MTRTSFNRLKSNLNIRTTVTRDNIQEKLLDFPKISFHLLRMYSQEREILNTLNTEIEKLSSQIKIDTKYHSGFAAKTKDDLEHFVNVDEVIYKKKLERDFQKIVCDYIESVVNQIQKSTFNFGYYLDIEKMKYGKVS